MKTLRVLAFAVVCFASAGTVAAQPTHPAHNPALPDPVAKGAPETPKTKLLQAGAEVLQTEAPLRSIHTAVCGFHFYSGEPGRQVVAHHFCSHLNEELMQCVIYDSNRADARLIGVEYIISERLFHQLPADERKLWHSHRHEVKSGELVALGLPAVAEKALMAKLVNTYGKTWHFWQIDRGDTLPLGIPQLMMGFTADGQIQPALLKQRDEAFNVSSAEKRAQRADLPEPTPSPDADVWMRGPAPQLQLKVAPASQEAPKP